MKTVFLRVLEADVNDKDAALRAAIHAPEEAAGQTRFEVEPAGFAVVPRSPFAYWARSSLLSAFTHLRQLDQVNRIARRTNSVDDDGRYVRLSTETASVLDSLWRPWAKGGSFSRYYYDAHTYIAWDRNRETFPGFLGTRNRPMQRPASLQHFFRPGITWPRRTSSGISLRVMPAGCIFGDKGPAIFVEDDEPATLLALNAILNSQAFGALVALQLAAADAAARSYEVGVIQRTPVPDLTAADQSVLATLARRAWSLKRGLDTVTENSHAFELPALLQATGSNLATRSTAYNAHVTRTLTDLDRLQAEIDDRCFALYGISDADRHSIERGFGAEPEAAADGPTDAPPADPKPLVAQLLSWSLGTALGRFDLRLATGERPAPTEPEPFDPLPTCAPGMLTGDDGLPLTEPPEGYPIAFPADGILVDDPGHPRDLTTAARAVFDTVFDTVFDDGDARWHEAADLVGARGRDLRAWFARDFFPAHIKTYSKSRRKAPIYWQLATPSASYSVWLYYHRLTRDTLYRLLNDFVAPKLSHEEAKLAQLVQAAGPEPARSQRAELDTQEAFVTELRAFKAEVARVAPLWNPNLNDGVIINFAPLWRLVPRHKIWQKEVKKVWDKLAAEEYEWAHLAMHLWPERVVPKCRGDRSLAIAHGLEGTFWYEDAKGKWHPREMEDATIQALIAERSSSAVKAALGDLVSAPAPAGGRKPTRRRSGKN